MEKLLNLAFICIFNLIQKRGREMKNKLIVISIMMILLIVGLCGCTGNSNELVGTWEVNDREISFTEDGKIYFVSLEHSYTYDGTYLYWTWNNDPNSVYKIKISFISDNSFTMDYIEPESGNLENDIFTRKG